MLLILLQLSYVYSFTKIPQNINLRFIGQQRLNHATIIEKPYFSKQSKYEFREVKNPVSLSFQKDDDESNFYNVDLDEKVFGPLLPFAKSLSDGRCVKYSFEILLIYNAKPTT